MIKFDENGQILSVEISGETREFDIFNNFSDIAAAYNKLHRRVTELEKKYDDLKNSLPPWKILSKKD